MKLIKLQGQGKLAYVNLEQVELICVNADNQNIVIDDMVFEVSDKEEFEKIINLLEEENILKPV